MHSLNTLSTADGTLIVPATGTDSLPYYAASQETAATHSYQTNEAYSYDANGNRTNTGYTTGTNNEVTSDGTYNYTYDAEGNMTGKRQSPAGPYEEGDEPYIPDETKFKIWGDT